MELIKYLIIDLSPHVRNTFIFIQEIRLLLKLNLGIDSFFTGPSEG